VLHSEHAEPVFRALFGGDMRRNLELFEWAIASPHIVQSDAYFRAERGVTLPERGAAEYIRKHRLLTSLMLGPWTTFRQRRSLVFLNVYNAQLSLAPDEMWRNTLLIPRLLDLFGKRGASGVDTSELEHFAIRGLAYSFAQLDHALNLLLKHGLIEKQRAGRENTDDGARLMKLTDCGRFYVDGGQTGSGLMYRLEYIQTVYWETHIPRDAYFQPFSTVMELSDLELFVLSFCDFLRLEEAQESKCAHSHVLTPEHHSLVESSLAAKIQDVAGSQVRNIYFKKRPD